jgi:hypothetical protein
MRKSSDTIENRTRDLPVFSAVPQQLHHSVAILCKVLAVIVGFC